MNNLKGNWYYWRVSCNSLQKFKQTKVNDFFSCREGRQRFSAPVTHYTCQSNTHHVHLGASGVSAPTLCPSSKDCDLLEVISFRGNLTMILILSYYAV